MRGILLSVALVACSGGEFSNNAAPEAIEAGADAATPERNEDAHPVMTVDVVDERSADVGQAEADALVEAEEAGTWDSGVLPTSDAEPRVDDGATDEEAASDAPPPLTCVSMYGFSCDQAPWPVACCTSTPCTCCNRACL